MRTMKRIIVLLILAAAVVLPEQVSAQNMDSVMRYRRSSLYSFMISHPDKKMDSEIVGAYMALETPDKYNNHDLSVKCITSDSKKEDLQAEVEDFFQRNQVAKRLVSKWFLRNKENGGFDASLVMERGLYDASAIDVESAAQTKRGVDALADKGYDLISNTFVIVNDITYVDHEANADKASGIMSIIGAVATAVTGDENNIVTSLTTLGSMVSSMIAGFAVNTTSYLYQLDWTDSVANYFYEHYYYDRPGTDSASLAAFSSDTLIPMKRAAYEADTTLFKLKYVGSYKVPISTVNGKTVTAKIGMKEGVTAQSKFEVLMPVFNAETGKFTYTRKGVLRPDGKSIWDNRYMASEEQAMGSELNATTFKVVTDLGIEPGMLIREIK